MTKTTILSSDQLIERAIAIAGEGRRKRIAVAAAQDVDVIDAVAQAQADGFISGVLVGDRSRIVALASEHTIDISGLELIDKPDVGEAARCAAGLASEKKADGIMKGFLPTSALLKTVLDKSFNLRGENTLSHCAVLDVPGYHKMMNFTDGGMVVAPDPEQKLQILDNAMLVARALGLSPVKVAVSAAVTESMASMPHTVSDVNEVVARARARYSDIEIHAPMPLDVAMSKEAARRLGVGSPVAGDADIFLVDTIEECNITCKSLIQFSEAVFCGVIVGARVPVSLVSRTDTVKNKKSSLALACVIADYYDQSDIWRKGGN